MLHEFEIARLPAMLCASLIILSGCGKGGPAQQHGGGGPAIAVVARANPELVEDTVDVVGTLEASDSVDVVSELDAEVISIEFAEGQRVSMDDTLFRLDEVRTKPALAEAEAAMELSRVTYERNKELLANETISKQEYDQAESSFFEKSAAYEIAKANQDNTVIKAPFDGIAGEHLISQGQFVTRGQLLTEVVAVDPMYVTFDIPERYIGLLEDSMNAKFVPDAYPQETFDGAVFYLAPQIDSQTRTIRVKALLDNPSGRLKSGMFGQVRLILDSREEAIVIPEACIQFMGGATSVMAINAEGLSEIRMVKVGKRVKSRAEITEGLSAGEYVVVEGFQKMGPGMPVVASPESEAYGVTPGPLTPESAAPALESERE